MPRMQQSITINAPAERVFAVYEDPERLTQYAPGVKAVTDVRRSRDRVESFRVKYAAAGMPFNVKFTTTRHERPARATFDVEGGLPGTWDVRLTPQGSATRLDLEVDYRLPMGPLGGALGALFLKRMNERNARTMLENLKRLAESEDASTSPNAT